MRSSTPIGGSRPNRFNSPPWQVRRAPPRQQIHSYNGNRFLISFCDWFAQHLVLIATLSYDKINGAVTVERRRRSTTFLQAGHAPKCRGTPAEPLPYGFASRQPNLHSPGAASGGYCRTPVYDRLSCAALPRHVRLYGQAVPPGGDL